PHRESEDQRQELQHLKQNIVTQYQEQLRTLKNLGNADLVEEASLGDVKILKIIGIKDMGTTTSVFVRGSNQLVLYEAERSLHDDLCVVTCMVSKRFLTSGGGAPDIELSRQLGAWAKILHGMEGFCVKFFAEALWLFTYFLTR
uniref:Uncharacterized protein n=2 Tax=Brassica TaxID=3705 RepID=A0A0D3CFZ6_BRAOL